MGYKPYNGAVPWANDPVRTTPMKAEFLNTLETHLVGGTGNLLIFYGIPNGINGKFLDEYAAGILAGFDHVVLGAGLAAPAHAYYASTVNVIARAKALNPGLTVWGYIDIGVTTNNYTTGQITTQATQWKTAGVNGVLLDCFEPGYNVDRTRQNAALNIIHAAGLFGILNGFNIPQVLGSAVDATWNPSGTPIAVVPGDAYLLESLISNTQFYPSPYWATASDFKGRAEAALGYRQSLGIQLFASNVIGQSGRTAADIAARVMVSEAIARIYGMDATGDAVHDYASSGTDVNVVRPPKVYFPRSGALGTVPPAVIVNGAWTEFARPDLGLVVTYAPGSATPSVARSRPAGTASTTLRVPASNSDAIGSVGDIASDDSYVYVKTSAGWKRSALSTF